MKELLNFFVARMGYKGIALAIGQMISFILIVSFISYVCTLCWGDPIMSTSFKINYTILVGSVDIMMLYVGYQFSKDIIFKLK